MYSKGGNQYTEDEAHVVGENTFPEIHLTEDEYPEVSKNQENKWPNQIWDTDINSSQK